MKPKTKKIAGRDVLHRMNYLYQASKLTSDISIQSRNKNVQRCADFISNYYSNLLVKVGLKGVMRIDTEIKRNICKGCKSLLISGKTAIVRVRRKPFKNVRWTCMKCSTVRIFRTKKDYKLWSERPQALVDEEENNEIQESENL